MRAVVPPVVRSTAAQHVDEERLAATLVELIDIPSPTGGEQALAEALGRRFAAMGLHTRLQQVEEGESNVIGRLPGSGGGTSLLLLGHLDTTWSGEEEGIRELGPGFQPKAWRDGDWIYGMGAYNMKSGLATAVEAVQAVVDSGATLRGELTIAGVVAESPKAEVGRFRGSSFRGAGKGARHLVTNGVVADCAVIPEPTSSQISLASGGYLFIELITRAHPAASYLREGALGDSPSLDAIQQMHGLLGELDQWGAGYTERSVAAGTIPLHYRVISIEGGLPYRPTKHPPLCRATVEIGVRPGQALADVLDEITSVVDEVGRRDERIHANLEVLQSVPGAAVEPEEAVVQGLMAAHRQEHDSEPELTHDGWLADTTHLTRYGIPAVCYGPAGRVRSGGTGFYATDGEQCYVPDLARGARVLARLVTDLTQRPRPKAVETARDAHQSTVVT